jgi:hypothetical protein
MTPFRRRLIGASLPLLGVLFVVGGRAVPAQEGGQADRVAALKQSMAASQKQLRQYEWIETTVISMKGEEKSRKQQRCYYGADGKLQKVPIESGQPQQSAGGGGGRRGGRMKQAIVENKKEEMTDYMQQAAGLVHQYVPPNPDLIEKSKSAGKFAARPGAAGRVGLDFSDYLKPGDRLSVEMDTAANRLLALSVASYLEGPEDVITLNVQFGALADGTSYSAETTLDAKAKNVRVVIQNTGHRPMGR